MVDTKSTSDCCKFSRLMITSIGLTLSTAGYRMKPCSAECEVVSTTHDCTHKCLQDSVQQSHTKGHTECKRARIHLL